MTTCRTALITRRVGWKAPPGVPAGDSSKDALLCGHSHEPVEATGIPNAEIGGPRGMAKVGCAICCTPVYPSLEA